MTRTDRRRFPVLFAAIAALALLCSPVQAQEDSAPAQPTGLSATASHDAITLTWDDPDDASITGYVILRRNRDTDKEGHFDELVADTGSAATTYTDNTVAAENRYTYRIKAINAYGVSERSLWFHVATPAAPVPAQPTGLSATASHDAITLTWDDPGDASITGYVILRRNRDTDEEGYFDELVADTGSAATTYTDNTVAAENRYTYRIKAINEHGVSERSLWFHVATPAAPVPAQPTGLSATATLGQVVLTWADPGDASITGYVILRRVRVNDQGGEFSELVPDTGTAATTYTDDTVAASTTYTYRIKAINAYGVSERSHWFHVATPAAPVPAQPTGLSATATLGQVVLTWADPGDASITGYVILRRVRVNDQGGEFSELVPDTGTAATTYTDDTVAASTTYTYRIKAINAYGVSERSHWFHVDIPAAPESEEEQAAPEPEEEPAAEPPAQPTGLSATASHDAITLTWDDPDDASITGYVILRRNRDTDEKDHFDELVADTGSAATTYTDNTVAAENRYTYRIKAINAYGVSERSRWFHVATPAALEPEEEQAAPEPEEEQAAPEPEEEQAASESEEEQAAPESEEEQAALEPEEEQAALEPEEEQAALEPEEEQAALEPEEEPAAPEPEEEQAASEPEEEQAALEPEEEQAASEPEEEQAASEPEEEQAALEPEEEQAASESEEEQAALEPEEEQAASEPEEEQAASEPEEEQAASESEEEQAAEPPAPPTGLTATASHDQVVLTWADLGDDSITGYVILRRNRDTDEEGHFDELVADTGSAATTYTDDTVADDTRYTYQIKAINAHGVSERSHWLYVATPAAEPPAPPTGLTAAATRDGVILIWADPGDDSITGYVILRRVRVNDQGGEFSELVPDTGTAATTYTDDTVAASTTYTYRIKAINAHGVSERSHWFHVETPAAPDGERVQPPAAPQQVLSAAGHDIVLLSWTDPQDDSITGYRILRADVVDGVRGEFAVLSEDTGSAAASYTDDAVEPERSYVYRVLAINPGGASDPSRDVEVSTPAAPQSTFVEADDPDEQGGEGDGSGAPGQGTPGGAGGTDKRVELRDVPPARQGFNASNGNEQVTLTWTAPAADADITRHEYRFKTTGDYPAAWTEIDDSAPGGAHEDWVVVENLTNDTAYTFQLRAANTDGAGTAAEAGPATPKSGFCGRTEQVRNKIMKQPPIKGVTEDCADVTTMQLAGVTGLYLANEDIRSLQPGDFSDLEALETLYLNNNELVSLPAGVFSDLEALETLYLNNNELVSLPAGAFSDLSALQDLQLNGNELVSLPAGVFSDLSALQDLALNHNALVSLPAGVFSGLTALDKLYLNNNELVLLPIDGFEDLSVLTYLILYHNELSSLPAGAFNGLTALDTLQLNSNKLTSLPAGVFSDLTKLELLWLSENELSSLPAGVFSDLEALTELRLNNNALSSLRADVFSGLTELQRLYLNVNKLTSLPADVFTGLTALTNLSLRSNKLGELPAGVFSDQTALGRLWLYDNDLTSLPAGVFYGLTALTTLELGDNPNTDRLLPLSVTLVTLENVGSDQVRQVRAEVRAGAPFTVDIPVTVANGALDGDATELRVAAGSVEGTPVTVTRTSGTTAPVTVDIDLTIQPSLPGDHDGYIFVVEGADLPANATTSGVVEVDGLAARGAIAAPTGYTFDTDWFRVELKAGRTYQIDMKGQILSSPGLGTPGEPVDPELTLSLPQINAIYDADGDFLVNTRSRDESSSHHLFRVTFHAHAGGTYYIAASGESFEWGGYELTVKDMGSAKLVVADGPPGLAPNAPNPFNGNTVILYRLDAPGPVRLVIYNILGQRIRTLVDEVQKAGTYRVRWDVRDAAARSVATGIYFTRLHYPGGVHTRRMLYLE